MKTHFLSLVIGVGAPLILAGSGGLSEPTTAIRGSCGKATRAACIFPLTGRLQ